MRNLFVLAAVFVALSVGVANAGYEGSTGSGAWTVAKVEGMAGSGDANHWNGNLTGVYETAVEVPAGTWEGWFTKHSNGDDATWISSSDQAKEQNGFYAYKTSISTNTSAAVTITGFTADILSDDHIDAIILNGVSLPLDSIITTIPGDGKGWKVSFDFPDLKDGLNMLVLGDSFDLIFVVHNSNSEGVPPYSAGDNPTGFAVKYDIATTTDSNVTPEPATLAVIGLGMFGAGFVARRRNRK